MDLASEDSRNWMASGTLVPHLIVSDAEAAVAWYCTALGGEALEPTKMSTGSILFQGVRFGSGMVMVADELPEFDALAPEKRSGSSVILDLFVDDADLAVEHAVRHGAELKWRVVNAFYGGRHGQIVDPFGHVWEIAHHGAPREERLKRLPRRDGEPPAVSLSEAQAERIGLRLEAAAGKQDSVGDCVLRELSNGLGSLLYVHGAVVVRLGSLISERAVMDLLTYFEDPSAQNSSPEVLKATSRSTLPHTVVSEDGRVPELACLGCMHRDPRAGDEILWVHLGSILGALRKAGMQQTIADLKQPEFPFYCESAPSVQGNRVNLLPVLTDVPGRALPVTRFRPDGIDAGLAKKQCSSTRVSSSAAVPGLKRRPSGIAPRPRLGTKRSRGSIKSIGLRNAANHDSPPERRGARR